MYMENTPQVSRLHIALIGRRNAGKSSLLNAWVGQDVAVVSDVAGTTTDAVRKAVELPGLGACVLLDTPGFDDTDRQLGRLRIERMQTAVEQADIVVVVASGVDLTEEEREWTVSLRRKGTPWMLALGKADTIADAEQEAERMGRELKVPAVAVSAWKRTGLDRLTALLLQLLPPDFGEETITGSLAKEGDRVLLVMPQDKEAPKGRLILPQVQTIRELLDKRCIAVCCTPDKMGEALASFHKSPELIITDSQVFPQVFRQKPADSRLTSFSVLFAAYKGDGRVLRRGAESISLLTEHSRVLIAEACAHVPAGEDIGRVKLPRLLRKRIGEGLQISFVSGRDFPQDLSPYQLVIHCGACMFNRRYVLERIRRAEEQGVPITNYGMAIAHLTGILHQIDFG
ncbi:[FeFe] hydrogenase H-cluster maturation GTPase HydF [uncultured Prevotella sp.]|uniref:[FeFe] hydrogenase H-cluster maturation GTPase HydF n=1 Tax=uncultured Prevotella sp. TaxID=159272 RepID=UPI00280622DB|nr:[FeFe] hydrogenase H-cluster maturation GTPase HydF [uncultured Prevotella sp.]